MKNIKTHKSKKLVNSAVLSGFAMLLAWILFFYKNTFVDITIVLGLLLLPTLVVTLLFYKKMMPVNLENRWLNSISFLVAYTLVTIPLGNLLVIAFFAVNTFLAPNTIQKVTLKPVIVNTGYQRRHNAGNRYYSYFEVVFDNVQKKINTGDRPVSEIEGQTIEFKLVKGYLGFYIIKGYTFQ